MSYTGPASRRKRAPTLDLHRGGTATTGMRGSGSRGTGARAVAARSTGASGPKSFRPLPRYAAGSNAASVFAAGIALGVVLGAGAALLLAPQSGADTRRSLARRTRRFGQHGHDAWDDLRLELKRLQRKAERRRAASSL